VIFNVADEIAVLCLRDALDLDPLLIGEEITPGGLFRRDVRPVEDVHLERGLIPIEDLVDPQLLYQLTSPPTGILQRFAADWRR
jgi:hypothetical protein